ncbi:MAG: 3-oxoacyl-ACP reductase FabG [Gammaproteobacteria bacterium]|nr:3-oxoacyl-ACP reductase FabG [Gammaproteobacteria bacterium]
MSQLHLSLEHKVALVTGASRGIGQCIAATLGAAGATVVGTATTSDGAARITQSLEAAGVRGRGECLDVTDPDNVAAVMKNLANDELQPLILVNNAGITRDGLLLRMKDDEWQQIIDTNLSAVFRLSRACLRGMMKARFGRIINIGSVVGTMGNPGQANYAAAKAGVIGFSKALAQEVGSRGVTVNTVAPGFIQTDMTAALNAGQRTDLEAKIPLGRLGEPEDIAASVAFLASDFGAYITGETLHVNGGMYMA